MLELRQALRRFVLTVPAVELAVLAERGKGSDDFRVFKHGESRSLDSLHTLQTAKTHAAQPRSHRWPVAMLAP